MTIPRTLVLWDIDHTLMNTAGAGRRAYADAFQLVASRPLEQVAEMAGRTDWAITVDTLRMHGIEASADLLQVFGDALARAFVTYESAVRENGHVLRGAREALEALAGRDDVVQSVLTGNMEPIAIGKLAAFDLGRFMDLRVGAFGMDHEDRAELVRLAQRRATDVYGQPFGRDNTVLVGDTRHDVQAGHLGGARVVAVATGASDRNTLLAAGAELVLNDLSDTPTVVQAILTPTNR
ncbi:haloacid dehalogenase [Sphaerisporangium siamense]|uniref:Phosphoglycolate phosphatase-like HAD superfamily hydrolase n=1 Tax=Sphaerisporangium siamense TaxID=795645 RepID=A0A7W7D2W1_9ACTN|nr:haloacid dehalogenase-like hydrolase [Sphaerisporangium siamense]MBB4699121.1 phosphoglycolate phosphatase-like HAD superfamily hydrolase [Sphaerisporangium siamense]GII86752.1 haloacid dehalogenase [Sphaerisporangium siamense]